MDPTAIICEGCKRTSAKYDKNNPCGACLRHGIYCLRLMPPIAMDWPPEFNRIKPKNATGTESTSSATATVTAAVNDDEDKAKDGDDDKSPGEIPLHPSCYREVPHEMEAQNRSSTRTPLEYANHQLRMRPWYRGDKEWVQVGNNIELRTKEGWDEMVAASWRALEEEGQDDQ